MEMQKEETGYPKQGKIKTKVFLGLILAVVGCLLLSKNFGYTYPDWLITWPMILIIIGLAKLFEKGISHLSWVPFILIGGLFLTEKIIPSFDVRSYILPVILIVAGLWIIFGKNKSQEKCKRRHLRFKKRYQSEKTAEENPSKDFIESVTVFGEVKKTIHSQDFKGGEIVTIMGGAQIDLSQADIQDVVIIEAVQIFGGTKLIIPHHWEVITEMAAIFGGIQDKRDISVNEINNNKKIIIKGVSIFGGIDIKNY